MKKIITVTLCLIFLLSFCSCGKAKNNKYSEITDALDAENYDEAIQLIQEMSGESSDTETVMDTQKDSKDNTASEKKSDADAIEVEFCKITSEGSYIHANFTVKNNLDFPVHCVQITAVFVDKNGNIINSTYPQVPTRLFSGKTETIEAMLETNTDAVSVYVDEISYDDDNDEYFRFYLDNPKMYKLK